MRRFPPGATVFRSGTAVRFMYGVETGAVSLERSGRGGALMILHRAEPGQILAEASAYSGHYHCDATVREEASLRVLERDLFLGRLRRDTHLAELWAEHLARAVQGARLRAEIRSLRTVAERLEAWLGQAGSLPPRGHWQVLAGELGVSSEALYRELARRRRTGAGQED
jgi:CRP-like cAMP-binding protein